MFKNRLTWGYSRSDLRQMAFPVEFRIAEPIWPDNFAEQFQRAWKRLTHRSVVTGLAEEQIIEIGTRLWQLRNELEIGTVEHGEINLNRVNGQLDALWKLLAKNGVDIYDHTGQIIPKKGTLQLKIIAFQPTKLVTRDRVIETIRPTIRFNGKIVQIGEVIVGTPEPHT